MVNQITLTDDDFKTFLTLTTKKVPLSPQDTLQQLLRKWYSMFQEMIRELPGTITDRMNQYVERCYPSFTGLSKDVYLKVMHTLTMWEVCVNKLQKLVIEMRFSKEDKTFFRTQYFSFKDDEAREDIFGTYGTELLRKSMWTKYS